MATESDAIAEADAFNDAFAAPDPAVEPDKGAGDGGEGGPARDAQGRFAGREEPAADQGQPQPQDRAPPEPERHHIPLAEHLSERERRQEAERRAAELDRELAAIRRARTEAEAAQARPEMPDPYVDPEGYAQWVREEARREAEEVRRETTIQRLDASFEDAKEQHGERFTQAYEAAMAEKASGNRQLVDRIAKSPNPGRALMKWYGEQEALRETGGDLAAYRKRILDEARKDPEYRKQVLADMEAEARGGGGIVDRSNITTIPSLTRASGGGSRRDDSSGDVFVDAFSGPRRR